MKWLDFDMNMIDWRRWVAAILVPVAHCRRRFSSCHWKLQNP
jgi:hypothetical protein